MKFSPLALMAALAAVAPPSTTIADSIFDPTNSGMDTLMKDHQWCCTDAWCCESCMYPGVIPGMIVHAPGTRFCDPATSACPDDIIFSDDEGECTRREVFLGMQVDPLNDCAQRFCEDKFNYSCRPHGSVCKDPHFKRWNGEWYDFHGECDLLFLQAPNFAKGLGLQVHIRTKLKSGFSYIETAAIAIGDDVLEVSSYGVYTFNGVDRARLDHGVHMGPYKIVHNVMDDKEATFDIVTEHNQTVSIKTWKYMVDVKVENALFEHFVDSSGMMGSFPFGKMVGRDGVTEIDDEIAFGMEWQVRADETQFFASPRTPQHPQQCIMPTAATMERRRLGENGVSKEEAQKACARWPAAERDMCIMDVMATGDLDLAEAGMF